MVFNLQGSEIIIILLLALVVLGPEKLPDAVRKFNQTYGELKKMGSGFQTELKSAIDEPMRQMRDTTDMLRDAADPTKATNQASADSLPLTAAPAESASDEMTAESMEETAEPVADASTETVDEPVAETADPSDPGSETVATPGDPPTTASPPQPLAEARDDVELTSLADDEPHPNGHDGDDRDDGDDGVDGDDRDEGDDGDDGVEATGETATA